MSNETATLIQATATGGGDPAQMLPMKGIVSSAGGGRGAILQTLLTALDPGTGGQNLLASSDDNTDGVAATVSPIFLETLARLTGFNGTTFDRLRTLIDSGDANASGVLGLIGSIARLQAFNGATFDRLRTLVDSGDAQASGIVGLLGAVVRLQAFNGATFDRLKTVSATNLAAFSGAGGLISAPPGEWAIEHRPAAATAATITRAAGAAGVRHVCKSITASLVATAAQGQIDVLLRDGATGAGTVLWSVRLAGVAGTCANVTLNGLNIVGSAATAMTLEFAAAPAATNFAGVALSGTDAS